MSPSAAGPSKGKAKGKRRTQKDDGSIKKASDAKDYADEDEIFDDDDEAFLAQGIVGVDTGCGLHFVYRRTGNY